MIYMARSTGFNYKTYIYTVMINRARSTGFSHKTYIILHDIYRTGSTNGLTIKPIHDIRGLEYKDDNYMGLGVQGVTLQKDT